MRSSFQWLTSLHPARRQATLCLPADLANAHISSLLGSADHSIISERNILDFVCTWSHKEGSKLCLPCRMSKGHHGYQIESPLPEVRVINHKTFGVTGINFAGTSYLKVGSNMWKGYIDLFTCATTRAVHLELCTDMSTENFLLALQRFVGRRGLPQNFYTDNAQIFYATNTHLAQQWSYRIASKSHQFLSHLINNSKLIAPRAAWWEGWRDRTIGTTILCVRNVLGRF